MSEVKEKDLSVRQIEKIVEDAIKMTGHKDRDLKFAMMYVGMEAYVMGMERGAKRSMDEYIQFMREVITLKNN